MEENQKVKIRVCFGGAWELVKGNLEYGPFNVMKRGLQLPLRLTHSMLMNRVARKCSIDIHSGFKLSYISNNDLMEITDDDDVEDFIDFVSRSEDFITLYVVDSVFCVGGTSGTGSNQQSIVSPSIKNFNPQSTSHEFQTQSEYQPTYHYQTQQLGVQSDGYVQPKYQANAQEYDKLPAFDDDDVDVVELASKELDVAKTEPSKFWLMPPLLQPQAPVSTPRRMSSLVKRFRVGSDSRPRYSLDESDDDSDLLHDNSKKTEQYEKIVRDDSKEDSCNACGESGNLLICETCTYEYHPKCLLPPLKAPLPTTWRCPKCVNPLNDIEKILDCEIRPTVADDSDTSKLGSKQIFVKQYLVKWKRLSYLHCTWVPEKEFIEAYKELPRLRMKVNNFRKHMPVGNSSEDDFVAIRPEYTMVDRILACRQDDEEKEYLVKWVGLNYDECYWESESDISSFQQQIENFNRLQSKHRKLKKQKSNVRDAADSKKKLKEFQQFEKSPEFLPGGELHPYQLEGLNFLRFSWSKQTHVILADEMGLGKSIQSIAFLASLYEENVSPHLVVAPVSTLRNWEREFAMWAPHMNVIVDEGHRLKNKDSKLFSALKQFNTRHRTLLTGTPLQNNLDELFMVMHFLDAGKLPSCVFKPYSLRISKTFPLKNCLSTFPNPHLFSPTDTPFFPIVNSPAAKIRPPPTPLNLCCNFTPPSTPLSDRPHPRPITTAANDSLEKVNGADSPPTLMENPQYQDEYFKGYLTIKARLAIVQDICRRLNDTRKELFGQTCFGRWLRVKVTSYDAKLIHLILQTQVEDDPPVPNELLFFIAGRVIRFRRQEFCLITGLRFGPNAIPALATTHKNNPPIRARLFSHIRKGDSVKLSDLIEIFDGPRFHEINNDDAIRISLIMLVDIGFLGRQPHQVVGDDILGLVEDLCAWNRFPWGSYIWSLTIPKLKKALRSRSKVAGMRYTLVGCVWALMIWIFEAFPLSRTFAKKPTDDIPRAIAWKRTGSMKWNECSKFLNVDNDVDLPHETLTPTDAELATDWWMDSDRFFTSSSVSRPLKKARVASPPRREPIIKPGSNSSPPQFDQMSPPLPHDAYDPCRDDMDGMDDTAIRGRLVALKDMVAQMDERIASLEKLAMVKDARIASLEKTAAVRDGRLASLEETASSLQESLRILLEGNQSKKRSRSDDQSTMLKRKKEKGERCDGEP